MPDPAERALYFPRYGHRGGRGSHRVAKWMQVKLVDPVSGEVITEGGPSRRAAHQGSHRVSRLPPGIERGGPFRRTRGTFAPPVTLLEIVSVTSCNTCATSTVTKDLVVRGGMKISASSSRPTSPATRRSPKSRWSPTPTSCSARRPARVVVARPGETPTLDELLTYLRELGIATFKLPERLELVSTSYRATRLRQGF